MFCAGTTEWKLFCAKELTNNLCPGPNIIHGDAIYATKYHLTQQQTIAIVQTHSWKLRHVNTPPKNTMALRRSTGELSMLKLVLKMLSMF